MKKDEAVLKIIDTDYSYEMTAGIRGAKGGSNNRKGDGSKSEMRDAMSQSLR